jgi:hypothetical protein
MWKKNGINTYYSTTTNTYTTSTLTEGDDISCDVTTSYCAPDPVQTSNTITMEIPSSVKQLTKDADFSLSPNPAKNVLLIKQSGTATQDICIRDIYGRTWLQHQFSAANITIDISSIPEGIYFAELISGQEKKSKMLLIEK